MTGFALAMLGSRTCVTSCGLPDRMSRRVFDGLPEPGTIEKSSPRPVETGCQRSTTHVERSMVGTHDEQNRTLTSSMKMLRSPSGLSFSNRSTAVSLSAVKATRYTANASPGCVDSHTSLPSTFTVRLSSPPYPGRSADKKRTSYTDPTYSPLSCCSTYAPLPWMLR